MGKILNKVKIIQLMKYLVIAVLFLAAACSSTSEKPIDFAEYEKGINDWHDKRVKEELLGAHGWVNLAGLYWLSEGFNTFGSDSTNDIVFPPKIDANAGTFMVQQGSVSLQAGKGVEIYSDSVMVEESLIYDPNERKQPVLRHGSLEWTIISRGGQLAVRLRDFESDALKHFAGVERYPVSLDWRVRGKFKKYDPERSIDITNILGQTYPQPNPGSITFEVGGEEFSLDVLSEGGADYFVIFGDETNGQETYPSGRYMYVSPADENGDVIIDFNKAYNPPCAFTEFATCPLPPRQNVLAVAITAGEKQYLNH